MTKENKGKVQKKLVPLNDHAFKRSFGEVGCEEQLIIIINGLTERTGEEAVNQIEIKERKIPRELYDDKEVELDIFAITDKGEQFDIESQLKNVEMDSRTMYYALRVLSKSVKKGQNYDLMKNVVVITIFGSRTEKEREKYEGFLNYKKSDEYIERYEFDMERFDSLKDKDINNPQHRCLMFLSEKTTPKMRKKVIKMEPKLEKAQKIMDYINSSPEEIELYEMRERVRMDIKNARKRDMQEGKELGLEKGKEEKAIEIVVKLIKENMPIKTISKITEISIEKIQKLKKEQEK